MNTPQATGLHLRQFISLLHRRWKLIAVAAGVAVSLVGTIWLVSSPRYTATAQLIVDPPRGSGGAAEFSITGVFDDAAVQTHVAALVSQSHLQRVFDSLVAELGPGPKEKRGAFGAEAFSVETFTARINAYKETHSRMIGITYTSTDPAFAASVANRSMELYLETLTDRTLADRNDALRNLSKQIPLVRAEVERARSALQGYRTKHGFTQANRVDTVDQQLLDLNRQLALAKSNLAERNAQPTALRADQTINQSQLAEENGALETRVRQLERRIAMLRDASTEGREPEGQLRELQREATAFAQLYESLIQRQRTSLGEGNVQPDVRILSSAAIPTLPSSLNPLLFAPPVMVLALIGAGLLVVLLEQLDTTLRTERDVADALGISCIGITPRPRTFSTPQNAPRFSARSLLQRVIPQGLRKRFLVKPGAPEGKMLRPYQRIPQDEQYTEAVRSVVAAALQLANLRRSPKTLLVTSSVAGEGKTTLAISFAVFAARIPRRVLLIDLSLREPSIANELGDPAEPIMQGRPLAGLIRPARGLGFDYLPLSRDSADPVATVAGERLPTLLRELKGSYDCIVIDGGPLLSAAEARLLAPKVDRVLFAIKWGSTPREVAQNALVLLQQSAFGKSDLRNAVTAVITQVDLEKHARYRYGDFSENLLYVTPHHA